MGGNIPPPYPITSSESLKKDTHRCFPTALVLNSNTESFPPSTCFSLLALWQEQSLSLGIQITPKRDTRWSPKTDGDLHGPPQAQPYLATPRQPSWSLPSSEHQHGWLASPCSLILPSLPSQYASMALAKLSEEERLLQRYPSPRRCGLLSFTLL